MEKSLINPLNLHLNSQISCNLTDEDDIEMIDFESSSMSYTTLKDIIIPSSPPSTVSPLSSWREIPIKDPLLQHAAWAYLQPMAEARDGEESWWSGFRERCFGMLGCFNDVVLVLFKGWILENSTTTDDEDEDKVH